MSPFSWRYGSEEMRRIWSEATKRRLWRRVWMALATAQAAAGLLTRDQLADLGAHQDDIDWERAQEIERELGHDLMAELKAYAEQCPEGGGSLHLGATSMDIQDNADALRLREALRLVREGLVSLLVAFAGRIEAEADTVVMAYTHFQPAQPTTLGYRLSQYAQDILEDLGALDRLLPLVRGKGFKGAVGTSASYVSLLKGTGMSSREMETLAMDQIGLEAYPITTQTYPRKMDYQVLCVLAGVAQSAHKFSLDVRLLQSAAFGEMGEPFGRRQVGSSAMPFKRNPVTSESVCSLARNVAGLPRVAWDNAAHSALERTLDDSANRRTILPEAFLAVDSIISRVRRVVEGLRIDRQAAERNLARFGPFAATEPLLMALGKAGADRQEMHECIRQCSMAAWEAVQTGEENPLIDLLASDKGITSYLSPDQVRAIMSEGAGVGEAAAQSRELVGVIRRAIAAA